MKKMIFSGILAVSLFLFIISFSIALPIYVRPFYYAHIGAMDLPSQSGFSKSEIKEAYDGVLDYLTFGREFDTGVMAHSPEGKSHFADCKALFTLNTVVLIASSLCLAVLFALRKRIKVCKAVPFYTALSTIVLPVVIGALASLNIDKAFVIFHRIFFPGKDNWVFDPRYDEIISVLPMGFFVNCGILIGTSVLLLSVIIMVLNKKGPH